MYCPQCGQLQPEEVRYCSRCGLWLYEVGQWLVSGAVPGHSAVPQKQVSARRKAILRAARVTFFSAVLFPVGIMLAKAVREPIWAIVPLVTFLASLVWILYCRLFIEGNASVAIPAQQRPIIPPMQYAPPFQKGAPAALEAHRVNTAEMVQPPSVTEYTTNLLKKDRG